MALRKMYDDKMVDDLESLIILQGSQCEDVIRVARKLYANGWRKE